MLSIDKISLKRIEFFQEVIKHQSVSAAAKSLGIPISTLDREILLLEKAMGVSLRAKDKKKLTLTEDGVKFTKFALETLNSFHFHNFNSGSDNVTEITISSTFSVCELYIPKVIKELQVHYPDIKVNVNAGDHFLNLNTNYSDIVIGPNLPNRPELSQTLIKEFKYFLFSTKDYYNKNKDNISKNIILYDKNVIDYRNKFPDSRCIATSNSYRTIIELGKLGLGVFPLPREGITQLTNHPEQFIMISEEPFEIDNLYFIRYKHSNKIQIVDKIKDIIFNIIK